MPAARYDVTLEQGATYAVAFRFGTLLVDGSGEPILDADGNRQIAIGRDFTGCSARMEMRRTKSTTGTLWLTVTSEDTDGGITLDNDGNILVVIPDELTDAAQHDTDSDGVAEPDPDGFYDLKIYLPDGTEDRLVEGTVMVYPAVTVDAAP